MPAAAAAALLGCFVCDSAGLSCCGLGSKAAKDTLQQGAASTGNNGLGSKGQLAGLGRIQRFDVWLGFLPGWAALGIPLSPTGFEGSCKAPFAYKTWDVACAHDL